MKKNVCNPATCNCEHGKDLASVIADSAILSRQILILRTSRRRPPPTSPGRPLKILFVQLEGRPDLTSWERPETTSRGRPNLTFKGGPWEVDSGRPQDVLRTPRRET